MVYLDSSAIVKLVRSEPETRELVAFLEAQPERISSVISAVEVPRAVRRMGGRGSTMQRAERVLERLDLVELSDPIRVRAAALEPRSLRSLDAIHIATALDVGNVEGLITYDARQAAAARTAGLAVVRPGA